MADQTESEFKLRARTPIEIAAIDAALRELGADCRSAECHQHVDTYLDDADGTLMRAGIGLRLRQNGTRRRLTCKSRMLADGHLVVRDELEADWPADRLPTSAAELPASLRDAVQPFLLTRPLQPRQLLEVQRDIRHITDDGSDLCELAIDRVEARANGRSATFQEVELEVRDGTEASERLARGLQQRLPLDFTLQDKPSHAAALLGLELPHEGTHDDATAPVGNAVPWYLGVALAAMRDHETGVRTGSDPEDLHQMRVSIRRMRSLLRAFRELWPEEVARRIDERLGENGSRLGAVRDLDVMLAGLPDRSDGLPTELRAVSGSARDWIERVRAREHTNLLAWLRSTERLHDLQRLEQDLAAIRRDGALAAVPMQQAAPAALGAAVARLRKRVTAIPTALPIAETHRLRLAAKQVRYLAETFAHLPDMDCGKSTRAVKRLQKRLGDVCDHEVAAERLLGWVHAAAANSNDGAFTAAVLGGLATAHHVAGQACRPVARLELAKLDRKRVWRRFPKPRA